MLVHDCWASLVTQLVKNLHTVGDLGSIPELERFPWRRAWQPTPVFVPGDPLGQRSLVGYSLWGCRESDTTERLSRAQHCWLYRALTAVRAFLVARTSRYSLAVVCSPLTVGLLLQSAGSGCTGFSRRGSQAQLPRSMQELPEQGSNPGPLCWQVDSLPLSHQRSPSSTVLSRGLFLPLPSFSHTRHS